MVFNYYEVLRVFTTYMFSYDLRAKYGHPLLILHIMSVISLNATYDETMKSKIVQRNTKLIILYKIIYDSTISFTFCHELSEHLFLSGIQSLHQRFLGLPMLRFPIGLYCQTCLSHLCVASYSDQQSIS